MIIQLMPMTSSWFLALDSDGKIWSGAYVDGGFRWSLNPLPDPPSATGDRGSQGPLIESWYERLSRLEEFIVCRDCKEMKATETGGRCWNCHIKIDAHKP